MTGVIVWRSSSISRGPAQRRALHRDAQWLPDEGRAGGDREMVEILALRAGGLPRPIASTSSTGCSTASQPVSPLSMPRRR